jgi:hypothetical protein
MPFGLRNAAQTFQRFIDEVLRGLPCVYAYIDDLLIASRDEQEYARDLRKVFQRLAHYGLTINPEKRVFGAAKVNFLGYLVNQEGIAPLPEKVQAIEEFPEPITQKALRRFLGMINFYHRFIPRAASILAPLNELLKERRKEVTLPEKAKYAFQQAKVALATATLLGHPTPTARLMVATDASKEAVGAVISEIRNEVLLSSNSRGIPN